MLTKEKLREKLRELNVVPPADATSDELVTLLRRVRALKDAETVRAPEGRRRPPPGRPRPTFAVLPRQTDAPLTVASPGAALAQARLPVSDHQRRSYDPMAGW